MPVMPLDEVERVFAMVLDTFKMGHHRSVVEGIDALILLHHATWLRFLGVAQRGNLNKLLAATCSCPYCSGAASEVQAEFPEMVAKHRRNMHHAMLAQMFFSDTRIRRTDAEIEELFAELEGDAKSSEDGEACQELEDIEWSPTSCFQSRSPCRFQ